MPAADFLDALRAIVGAAYVLTPNADDLAPYANDQRRKYYGKPLAVVKPGSPEEVAAIVKLCAQTHTPIVPQAGNTSLCGASVPDGSGTQLILNVSRMNRVREMDVLNNTMTVEAGCILQHLQQAADAVDRLFPVSLGAEGSCQIGGNLSTNAGGVNVLRYGNTREMVLGLEVVLPSGEIWHGLRALRKDNTGYDLKQLFVGAEGTLGIITAATLKLFPKPKAVQVAFTGLNTTRDVLQFLTHMKSTMGERLTAFEMISAYGIDLVEKQMGHRSPLSQRYPWQVLLEVADSSHADALAAETEEALGSAMEAGLILDAAIAKNETENHKLWALRENITEAQAREGRNIKHDVSIPISKIPEFVEVADAALEAAYPGVRPVNFGHVGDGNLHYNVAHPEAGFTESTWVAEWEKVNNIVHGVVRQFNGSISAEHGIGQLKREEIKHYKSALELQMMRQIKDAFDPLGIMNPGKVL